MKILLGFLVAAAAWAQPLTVYSDLAEIDATGKVIAPETPREILSPALIRNGFTSFQVVVEAPADKKWWLFIGQNPADSVKVTMYRESAGKLEPVDVPRQSSGTEVLWLDVWTDRNAPIARIKIEPELMVDDDWVIYPIEGRVMEATISGGPREAVGSKSPWEVLHDWLCAPPRTFVSYGPDTGGVLAMRFRNALQDTDLLQYARRDDLLRLAGTCDDPRPSDPEWYLRIRDYLYRLR